MCGAAHRLFYSPQAMMLSGPVRGQKTLAIEQILAYAHADRVLVTLDKDFGEFAVVRGQQHSGIIRLVDSNNEQQEETRPMAIK